MKPAAMSQPKYYCKEETISIPPVRQTHGHSIHRGLPRVNQHNILMVTRPVAVAYILSCPEGVMSF